ERSEREPARRITEPREQRRLLASTRAGALAGFVERTSNRRGELRGLEREPPDFRPSLPVPEHTRAIGEHDRASQRGGFARIAVARLAVDRGARAMRHY